MQGRGETHCRRVARAQLPGRRSRRYRFFPAARTLDDRDCITADDFSGVMRDAGSWTWRWGGRTVAPVRTSAST